MTKDTYTPTQLYKITHQPTGLVYYRIDLEKWKNLSGSFSRAFKSVKVVSISGN